MAGREVANTGPLAMPPRSTPEQHRRIMVLDAAVESNGSELTISSIAAPTHQETRGLEGRQAVLRAACRSIDPKMTTVAIAKMLASMTTYTPTDADVALKVKEYALAVSTFPTWAVEEACQVWQRGGYGITNRPPTSAELVQRTAGEVRPFLEEQQRIHRILKARVEEPLRRMANDQVDAMVAAAKGRIVDGSYFTEKRAKDKAEFDKWTEANDQRLRERDDAHRAEVEASRKAASIAEARG